MGIKFMYHYMDWHKKKNKSVSHHDWMNVAHSRNTEFYYNNDNKSVNKVDHLHLDNTKSAK